MNDSCFFINHTTRQIRRCDNRAWENLSREMRVAFELHNWNINMEIELFILMLGDPRYVWDLIRKKGYDCDYPGWFDPEYF